MAAFSWIHKKNRTDEAQTHMFMSVTCTDLQFLITSLLLVVKDFDFVQTCVNG